MNPDDASPRSPPGVFMLLVGAVGLDDLLTGHLTPSRRPCPPRCRWPAR